MHRVNSSVGIKRYVYLFYILGTSDVQGLESFSRTNAWGIGFKHDATKEDLPDTSVDIGGISAAFAVVTCLSLLCGSLRSCEYICIIIRGCRLFHASIYPTSCVCGFSTLKEEKRTFRLLW